MPIGSIQFQPLLPAPMPGGSFDKNAPQTVPANSADNATGGSVGWTGLAIVVHKYKDLVEEHQVLNSAARNVRIADHAMEKIGKVVDALSNTVDTIRKDYPPFPAGSEDRVRMLRSYSELRKQIDRLTVPPEPGASQDMADPAVSAGSDGTVKTVPKEQVHMWPTALDIPVLSEHASGPEVEAAANQLAHTKETLQASRQNLQTDALALAGSAGTIDQGVQRQSAEAKDGLSSVPFSLMDNWNTDVVKSMA